MNAKSGLLVVVMALSAMLAGCAEHEPVYGVERPLTFPASRGEVWAVAPVINLSGYREVDPLIQADLVYAQLQQVRGLTVIPVNRVAEVYATMQIDKVQTPDDVVRVCTALGCDRLVVATVTAYDPYVPPKLGASLQVLAPRHIPLDGARQASEKVEARAGEARPEEDIEFVQAVGVFDAANGSVRESLRAYAEGRNDPAGPMGTKEYLASIDRYCGFVYHELIVQAMSRKQWDEWKR